MPRIVVELTNRCNLRCGHCFDERHAATGELPIEILDKVLSEGRASGIDHVSFTGGEPTLHPRFAAITRRVCRAGYTFSFVSNGSTMPRIYPLLVQHRQWFKGVTFSLDGARQQTHDALRGDGSYRQVMRAASVSMYNDLPFTLNMVLTARNRSEVAEMVHLAASLGSRGVRFGHLMATVDTGLRGLDLTPEERRETEVEIWQLKRDSLIPVGMAPGFYSESPFFPCGPLELEEFNLDCKGNLTLCCHLSGQSGPNEGADLICNLKDVTLAEGCARFRTRVATYLADKRERVRRGEFGSLDHFPCWYCAKYLGKLEPLRSIGGHRWLDREAALERKSL